jgi:sugar phosphate permease
MIIGFWQSCGNFGNVAGALLTSFLTSTIVLEWEMTFLLIGQLCLILAIVNCFILVVHPEEKGIVIEEIDDKMNMHEEMLRRHTL